MSSAKAVISYLQAQLRKEDRFSMTGFPSISIIRIFSGAVTHLDQKKYNRLSSSINNPFIIA
jgi:hypothetical protein